MSELLLSDADIVKIGELHSIWRGMLSRCASPRNNNYHNYGGRGIKVCDQWINNFPAFVRDMWPRPDGTTLDRKNNDEGYSKSNCRWANKTTQIRNRRVTRFVTLFGVRRTLAELADEYKINYFTLFNRLDTGWTPEQAVGAAPRIFPLTTALTHNGETLGLKEMAAKHGLTAVCLKKRLESGMSLATALAMKVSNRGGKTSLKKVTVNGKTGTIKQFAKQQGLDYTKVYGRLQLGWPLKQALGLEARA